MSNLGFRVLDARPEPYAAVPTLAFRLAVEESDAAAVHCIALRCQIRIEPQRRRYSSEEQSRLVDLFGDAPRWGETLKPFLWTHVTAMVGGFERSTELSLPVACTYDLDVAAAKYLHGLDGGEIPLLFLFSGTVFSKGAGGLRVSQIGWDREASYRLPAAAWRATMDLYFPNGGWLRLQRETIDALLRFKGARGLTSFDEAIELLLRGRGEEAA
jgi:uncharacterized protein DUF6084